MQPSIWTFLLFLGSQLLFFIVLTVLMSIVGLIILKDERLRSRNTLLTAVVGELIAYFFLSLFIRILTGENFFITFTLLAALSNMLMLFVELLWLIFGARDIPYAGRIIWARWEFQKLVPAVMSLTGISSILIFIAYNIYLGIGYFGERFESGDWPEFVFRMTLVFLFGMSWLVQLPASLHVMTSENVMQGTRSRLFIGQLAASVSILMLMSLYIWAANWEGRSVVVFGERFVFTPTIAYGTLGYVLLVIVLPYLIGHFRAKGWTEELGKRRMLLVDKLKKALTSASVVAARQRLAEVEQDIDEEVASITETKGVRLAIEVLVSENPKDRVFRMAVEEAKDRDPRFIHLADLTEMLRTLGEYETALDDADTKEEGKQLLADYLKSIEDVAETATEARSPRPWVLPALTSLVLAPLTPIISSAAKMVVARIGLGE